MSNERLRGAVIDAGLSINELAVSIGVDAKTVERWVSVGRVPHRAHRLKAAQVLGADDAYLWPTTAEDQQSLSASQAEVVSVYQNRGSINAGFWVDQLTRARTAIDVLAFAGTFLHDAVPDSMRLLRDRLDEGVQVRLLLGNPTSKAVRRRGDEEAIGNGLRGRVELTWSYFRPVLDHPCLSARQHGTTLYCSVFRFDDDLLANHHLYGAPAAQSPVLHLRRVPGGRLFLNHLDSFDRVWDGAEAVT